MVGIRHCTSSGSSEIRFDFLQKSLSRARPENANNHLALFEQCKSRHTEHLVPRGSCRILVDIDCHNPQPGLLFTGDLLQDRRDHAARAAPLRGEFDQHRHGAAQHIIRELFVGGHCQTHDSSILVSTVDRGDETSLHIDAGDVIAAFTHQFRSQALPAALVAIDDVRPGTLRQMTLTPIGQGCEHQQ